MLRPNPIILKELIQAGRRRWTFILRTLLPAVAILLLLPDMISMLGRGQDWRMIARVARPIFEKCAWTQLIAFPLLAAVYARGALQGEWTNRTMETLCSTPLSRAGMLYGKFASILGKIVLVGLALLPLMGLWFRMGRIPSDLALGTLGLIAAATVLFGGLTFLRSAMLVPGKAHGRFCLDLLLLYLAVPILAAVAMGRPHPWLVAAVPPWAFGYVVEGISPGGMAFGRFALLAIAEPLVVGVAALLLTPWLFRRALARSQSGRRSRRGRRWLGHRPRFRTRANPFVWQERGPASHVLTYGPFLLGVLPAALFVGLAWQEGGFRFLQELLREASTYSSAAIIGTVIVGLMTVLYTTRVFAREKARNTAQALLLTGHSPWGFYLAKLRALFWGLRYALLVVAGFILLFAVLEFRWWAPSASERWLPVLSLALGATLGVLAMALVGLAFSVAARSPWQALGVFFLSFIGAWIVNWVASIVIMMVMFVMPGLTGPSSGSPMAGAIISIPALLGIGAMALICVLVKRWNAWLVGLLLALNIAVIMSLLTGLLWALITSGFFFDEELMGLSIVIVSAALVVGMCAFWLLFGVRIFDRCMRGESGRGPRRTSVGPPVRPVVLLPTTAPVPVAQAVDSAPEAFLEDPRFP